MRRVAGRVRRVAFGVQVHLGFKTPVEVSGEKPRREFVTWVRAFRESLLVISVLTNKPDWLGNSLRSSCGAPRKNALRCPSQKFLFKIFETNNVDKSI